jgi:hypothetical protein
MPSPLNPPTGCRFHTRCASATEICRTETPVLRSIDGPHAAACHHVETLPEYEAAVGVQDQTPAAAQRLALYAERRARVTEVAG